MAQWTTTKKWRLLLEATAKAKSGTEEVFLWIMTLANALTVVAVGVSFGEYAGSPIGACEPREARIALPLNPLACVRGVKGEARRGRRGKGALATRTIGQRRAKLGASGKLFGAPAWALPVPVSEKACIEPVSPIFLRPVPAQAPGVPVKTGSTTASHQPCSTLRVEGYIGK